MTVVGRRVALEPGGGEDIPDAHGRFFQLKARSVDTAGAYSLMEERVPPGLWTPAHIHHDAEEAWYVLEGELSFRLAEDEFVARAGSFVLAPRGTVHAFGNTGAVESRHLFIFSPPGMERYFVALHELILANGGELDPATGEALRRQFHVERVPLSAV